MVDVRLPVFISWSGEQSEIVAKALKQLLKNVIQTCEPFMSKIDIEGGSKWLDAISGQLEESGIGIICVTAHNQNSPWLNFEAGAISTFARHLKPEEEMEARVCPYLLGMKAADLKQPLAMFQAKPADRDGTLELIQMVNRQVPVPLSDAQLKDTFSKFWSDFDAQLVAAQKMAPASAPPQRSSDDKIDEVLSTVREILRQLAEAQIPLVEGRLLRRLRQQGAFSSLPSLIGSTGASPQLTGALRALDRLGLGDLPGEMAAGGFSSVSEYLDAKQREQEETRASPEPFSAAKARAMAQALREGGKKKKPESGGEKK
jgi:hypothetical protein